MKPTAIRGLILKALSMGLLVVVLAACLPCAPARADGGTIYLYGSFASPASPTKRTWQFPYDDALFDKPADQYAHLLAQASLGMALSAFRTKGAPLTEQDAPVRAYLTQAGFSAFVAEQYDVPPTKDTIATMIGKKTIGDCTVVAVAVSGGGYGDEWLSNFDIGDEERHRGFGGAAEKVNARIRAYLDAQGVTGKIKLWISGYSRAAAVSNLVAADMTQSGLFESVYAYTFATPRNTRAPQAYGNIFNIMGKFDPVPCVPFAEWGYARYGVDLYTPAQETDSRYRQMKAAADDVSQMLTGLPFWNNVDVNNNLRTILDYLLGILPDSALYTAKMQPILNSVWHDRSLPNLSGAFVKLMNDAELLKGNQKYEMEYLMDYLSMTTYTTVTGQTKWNAKTTMADNLMHEHSPDVYVSWLFSTDDPAELYTGKLTSLRVAYEGSVRISVIGPGESFCLTVDENGNTSDWTDIPEFAEHAPPPEQRALIAVRRQGTQTIITLPKDEIYTFYIEALKTESLGYFGTEYKVGETRGKLDEYCITQTKAGEGYTAISLTAEIDPDGKRFYGDDDIAFSPWSDELPYSPSVIMAMETQNTFHLTWTQLAWIVAAIVVLVVAVAILVTVLLLRRHRRKKTEKAAQAAAAAEGTVSVEETKEPRHIADGS